MVIQIYHGNELYGTYEIKQVFSPSNEDDSIAENQQELEKNSMMKDILSIIKMDLAIVYIQKMKW